MVPTVARPGQYVRLDMGEKLQIATFLAENPNESFSNVARIFSRRLEKNINKMHVCRIKKDRENVQRCAQILPTHKKNKSEDVIRFEKVLYEQLAEDGPQCFEQAQMHCLSIQKGPLFKNCPDVQKMKFSRDWWQRFRADRGMRWNKICANRKSFSNNEVEEERKRLLAIVTAYIGQILATQAAEIEKTESDERESNDVKIAQDDINEHENTVIEIRPHT